MSDARTSPSWSRRVRYRLEYAALSSAVWFIPKLPRRLVNWISGTLGTLTWLADARGRRTGMENLRVALGPALTVARRRRILRASYRIFAATFLDLFWSPRIREDRWDRCFILQCDTDAARAALKANNCLYVTAHLGGFELLNVAKALHGSPAMTIAQNFRNPALTAIFSRLRSVGGRQEMIPQEGAMLRLFRHLKKGGSAAALVDLKVDVLRNGTPMRTFGMLTSASPLHCVLAQRTGVPIVPLMALPAADGRQIIRFCDPLTIAPDESMESAMQRCWAVFETVIREQPELWLWMYKHWRYLPDGADPAAYPGYAQKLPDFDAMLRAAGIAGDERSQD
jgi:KDO2-lipid IV(A) lauroyltransferase